MKGISKEQIIEDLQKLQRSLEKTHPNLYQYIPETDFSNEITSLIDNYTNISNLGLGIMQLLAQLKDGHTYLGLSDKVLGSKNFMFKFQFLNEGYYLTKSSQHLSQYLGSKLKGINNYNIKEIEKKLFSFIPQENEVSTKYYLSSKIVEPKILEYLDIKTDDYITLHLELEQEAFSVQILPEDYNNEMISIESKIPNIADTLSKKNVNWAKVIPEDEAFYLQYNKCEEDKDFDLRSLVDKFEQSEMSTFIIDLRNNTGGDSDILEPLLNYLRKNDTRFKKIILTGLDTYSSAIVNLLELSSLSNTISLGEIPHGNPTHYGEVKSFVLPNSRFQIFCSSKLFSSVGYDLGESFKPNYIISNDMESLRKGIDKQIEYISQIE
jgi:hypothetical protein